MTWFNKDFKSLRKAWKIGTQVKKLDWNLDSTRKKLWAKPGFESELNLGSNLSFCFLNHGVDHNADLIAGLSRWRELV